jgi:dihydrofolate synthase/folylpolyglutamate synthase
MWIKLEDEKPKSPQLQAKASVFTGPVQALQAAIEHADPADRIVVFGSFYTVGGVLENGIPRLDAPHLSNALQSSPMLEVKPG